MIYWDKNVQCDKSWMLHSWINKWDKWLQDLWKCKTGLWIVSLKMMSLGDDWPHVAMVTMLDDDKVNHVINWATTSKRRVTQIILKKYFPCVFLVASTLIKYMGWLSTCTMKKECCNLYIFFLRLCEDQTHINMETEWFQNEPESSISDLHKCHVLYTDLVYEK